MLHLTRIVAGILVLLGLSLGVFAWRLARAPAPAPVAAAAATAAVATGRPVVVAARPLPAGRMLEAADLRIDRLAVASAAALNDPAPLIGRVPVVDLPEGMPLALALFSGGLAQHLAPGERAVAVHVDETIGVGHQVRPGDFVDVYLVLKRDGGEVDQSRARLLMARNRVLAYGGASVDGPAAGAPAPGARQEPARTVVLSVPADRIDQLTLGETHGRLFLALRHPQDADAPDAPAQPVPVGGASAARRGGAAPGHTLRQLAGQGAAPAFLPTAAGATPAPAASPAPVHRVAAPAEPAGPRVEIIRGTTQETLAY